MILRLGTRGSRLALWQADRVKLLLERQRPGLTVEIRILHTTGDRIADVPLAKIGDKGLFTKELDRAILSGEVDAAVHSLKDVPTVLAEGLVLGAVLEREDPSDVLLPAPGRPATLDEFPAGAKIGTSSLRRRAQLMHLRPDLVVQDLRGNLDTRFARLREGPYDAAILARAGVIRLGHEDAVGSVLAAPAWLPAAGQGAIGIAAREGDATYGELIAALDDDDARTTTTAERAFLRALEGGCQIPIGALATRAGERLELQGLVAALDGAPLLRGEIEGDWNEAAVLGRTLAQRLLDQGAGEILERIRSLQSPSIPHASAP